MGLKKKRSPTPTHRRWSLQLQGDALVKVQPAVAGLVAGAGLMVQTVQQRQELLEILEALKLLVGDRLSPRHGHAAHDAPRSARAQGATESQLAVENSTQPASGVPNRIAVFPI